VAVLCPNCGREYDITLFQFGTGVACDCGAEVDPFGAEPVEMPIDGVLDLHTFQPADAKDLVPDYLEACRAAGILRIRIVHGKGTGALLQTVHAILARLPDVEAFALADSAEGGWGATIVTLKP
jgi:dsDNA-specific endonuclease/ATPase MutS2